MVAVDFCVRANRLDHCCLRSQEYHQDDSKEGARMNVNSIIADMNKVLSNKRKADRLYDETHAAGIRDHLQRRIPQIILDMNRTVLAITVDAVREAFKKEALKQNKIVSEIRLPHQMWANDVACILQNKLTFDTKMPNGIDMWALFDLACQINPEFKKNVDALHAIGLKVFITEDCADDPNGMYFEGVPCDQYHTDWVLVIRIPEQEK